MWGVWGVWEVWGGWGVKKAEEGRRRQKKSEKNRREQKKTEEGLAWFLLRFFQHSLQINKN
ncbi:MAG: hypothetical protein F6K55_05455 [Moorea sp. SIO4A3]|nr:hypothetical protein [Moorena sp. SIO4A3]